MGKKSVGEVQLVFDALPLFTGKLHIWSQIHQFSSSCLANNRIPLGPYTS